MSLMFVVTVTTIFKIFVNDRGFLSNMEEIWPCLVEVGEVEMFICLPKINKNFQKCLPKTRNVKLYSWKAFSGVQNCFPQPKIMKGRHFCAKKKHQKCQKLCHGRHFDHWKLSKMPFNPHKNEKFYYGRHFSRTFVVFF